MNSLARRLLVGLGAGALSLAAQTTITDDFASDHGNWAADVGADSTFSLTSGSLNYLDGGTAGSATNSVYRDAEFSATAGANWQARIDLTLALSSQVAGQVTMWRLYAASLTSVPSDDYFVAELNQNYMQSGFRILNGTQYTNASSVASMGPVSLSAGTISLQLAYDAAADTITLGYDADGATGGYSFTTVNSVSTATWLLTSTDEFGFRLMGVNTANAGATGAIGAGESQADNFALTVAAIPEPATSAAALGVLALFTMLRRRIR